MSYRTRDRRNISNIKYKPRIIEISNMSKSRPYPVSPKHEKLFIRFIIKNILSYDPLINANKEIKEDLKNARLIYVTRRKIYYTKDSEGIIKVNNFYIRGFNTKIRMNIEMKNHKDTENYEYFNIQIVDVIYGRYNTYHNFPIIKYENPYPNQKGFVDLISNCDNLCIKTKEDCVREELSKHESLKVVYNGNFFFG